MIKVPINGHLIDHDRTNSTRSCWNLY